MELINTDLYVIAMNDVLDYIDVQQSKNSSLASLYEDAGIDSEKTLTKLNQSNIACKQLKYAVEGILGNYLMKNQTKLLEGL